MPGASRMVFKITVLGDGGVGKTALTVQFTMSSFVEAYDPTIEDCYRKQWVVDDQPCLLEVLDTAGQEEYTALRDQWIRDGEGFLVVYDITSRLSFERVGRIVERVHRVKEDSAPYAPSPASPSHTHPGSPYAHPASASAASGSRRPPIVLVGNKADDFRQRQVGTDEATQLARNMGCGFFETSAKTGANVEAAFKSVVRNIKSSRSDAAAGAAGAGAVAAGGGGGGSKARKKGKKCVIL